MPDRRRTGGGGAPVAAGRLSGRELAEDDGHRGLWLREVAARPDRRPHCGAYDVVTFEVLAWRRRSRREAVVGTLEAGRWRGSALTPHQRVAALFGWWRDQQRARSGGP